MSTLVSPLGRTVKVTVFPLAARPRDLNGKRIALYHNDKVNSFPIMKTIGTLLKEKIAVNEIFEVHAGTPFSRHPDTAIAEALTADVIFAANAD